MNYNEFKNALVIRMNSFEGPDVKIIPSNKINLNCENLMLDLKGNICPSLNLENLYQEFLKSDENLSEFIKRLYEGLIQASEYAADFKTDINKLIETDIIIQDKVFATLVNTEMNKEILKNIPHRHILNLSLVYRFSCSLGDETGTILITNEMMEKAGLNEEGLYLLHKKNKLFPVKMECLKKLVARLAGFDLPEEMVSDVDEKTQVFSTEARLFGSICLSDKKIMDKAAKRMNGDIYILPSSIHECLVFPSSFMDKKALSDMLLEGNHYNLDKEDFLSNQIYFYDSKNRELSIATNNPESYDALFDA